MIPHQYPQHTSHVVRVSLLEPLHPKPLNPGILHPPPSHFAVTYAQGEGGVLMRAAEAYTSAVGFVDASDPGCWRMLHLNKAAIRLLGEVMFPWITD